MRAMKHSRAVPSIWVLAENEDDLNYLLKRQIGSPERSTLIPGAGVEAPMPAPFEPVSGRAPVAVFVGRMVRSKGVHTLVEAYKRLTPGLIHLALYGAADVNNPEAIPNDTLTKWSTLSGLTWHGHVQDITQIWTADQIAVIPSLGGEGMPRAMLEAAASGRPLIVSDVPGCRHFVRQGVEGLVVPPGDIEALANALAHLAKDQALRRRLGLAARGRFLAGFTTDAVRRAIHEAYRGSAGATI
jgi:glycosyltransferase involved in cell wall biosynthesis